MNGSPKPLIVLPVCSYDVDNALKNLELCSRFNPGQMDLECLLHYPKGFDSTGVRAAAEKVFKKVHTNVYDDCPDEKAWPRAANWAWQNAARAVSLNFKVPWFWWEQDAIPLIAGWLDKLVDAYLAAGKPFGGHIVTTEHNTYMNGVGFYPAQVARYAPTAMRVVRHPFDIVAGQQDGAVAHSASLNALMGHDHAHRSVSFSTKEDVEALTKSGLVIFHHNKDGSIYSILTGRPVPRVASGKDVPSFLEQTPWPSGMFAFPPEERTVYFNSSLLRREDEFYLFCRRYRFPNGHTKLPMTNDLAIWRLSKHLSPIEQFLPEVPGRYPREQWEDPRVIEHQGSVYVALATWVHMKGWNIRQSLVRLSADWRRFTPLLEPRYGGNAPEPESATRHEKNWLWFMHESAWHCLYMTNPMTVFRMNPNGNVAKVWKGPQLPLPWCSGEPRGGTTPIRMGDEYVTFFHSSMAWSSVQRRYFMGAVTFEAHPPFGIRRITPEPLLSGSDKDSRVLGGPLVIFPCGAAKLHREWLVTFGVNDEGCGWIKVPDEELQKLLVPVQRPATLMERAKALVGV